MTEEARSSPLPDIKNANSGGVSFGGGDFINQGNVNINSGGNESNNSDHGVEREVLMGKHSLNRAEDKRNEYIEELEKHRMTTLQLCKDVENSTYNGIEFQNWFIQEKAEPEATSYIKIEFFLEDDQPIVRIVKEGVQIRYVLMSLPQVSP